MRFFSFLSFLRFLLEVNSNFCLGALLGLLIDLLRIFSAILLFLKFLVRVHSVKSPQRVASVDLAEKHPRLLGFAPTVPVTCRLLPRCPRQMKRDFFQDLKGAIAREKKGDKQAVKHFKAQSLRVPFYYSMQPAHWQTKRCHYSQIFDAYINAIIYN